VTTICAGPYSSELRAGKTLGSVPAANPSRSGIWVDLFGR